MYGLRYASSTSPKERLRLLIYDTTANWLQPVTICVFDKRGSGLLNCSLGSDHGERRTSAVGTLGSFGCTSLFDTMEVSCQSECQVPPAESPTTVFFSGKPSLMRWRCITRQRVNFTSSRKRGDGSLSRLSLPTEAILDTERSTKRRT